MSTLKVNTINAATADQGVAVDVQNPRSFRNLIINGAMNVAQRGTSSTSTSYQTVDRFLNSINGGTVTQAQHALTSSDTGPWAKGFRNSYHQTNTSSSSDAAANFRNVYYYVEAQDLANSGWDYTSSSSYITLSFWAKSSLAGTYYIQLRSQDGTGQNYASPYTLVADTWKKITVKIPGNSNIQVNNDNGAGLIIYWVLDYGTNFTSSLSTDTWAAYSSSTRTPDFAQDWTGTANATFEITGVQLEVGEIATDFEHRSYGDELARCQRYCYKVADGAAVTLGTGVMYTSSVLQGMIQYPVTMRTTPTISATTGTNYYEFIRDGGTDWFNELLIDNRTSPYIAEITNDSQVSGTSGHGGYIRTDNSAVKVIFNAEL